MTTTATWRDPGTARVATLVLLWIPCATSLALRLLWWDAPARVPVHWGTTPSGEGVANGMSVWLVTILVAAASAGIGTASVLAASGRAPRRSAALGGLITSGAVISWPVLSLSALANDPGGTTMGPELLLYALALLWGGLAYLAAAPLALRAQRPR